MYHAVRKIWRFARIYGITRTLYKIAGRSRSLRFHWLIRKVRVPDIGVIGCGQFGFATIGYVIGRNFGKKFVSCYDINSTNAKTFGEFYQAKVAQTAADLINNKSVQLVYVVSNHASHTDYALQCINSGKVVYIEKPISVSKDQLKALIVARKERVADVYAGYNRPFSGAIRDLKSYCKNTKGAITLSCFVTGHFIPPNHWYRKPEEGTRVCGNIGHWIDLAVHILSWDCLPDKWEITIIYSDLLNRDDNLSISLTSERGDLISILLTARCEPFEGINETISFQWSNIIAKIDDFRKMTVWRNEEKYTHRYWPKDVGHHRAILQPFLQEKRDWHEIELSTLLMLLIMEMVVGGRKNAKLSLAEEMEKLLHPYSNLNSLSHTM